MHVGSMFESHLKFGQTLLREGLLNSWIIFDEHDETAQEAVSIAEEIGQPAVLSIVQQSQARFAIDPRTGSHWSSSKIIERIIGGAR